jgi:hypothetical protein
MATLPGDSHHDISRNLFGGPKINSFDPLLPTGRTAYAAQPLLLFLHPPTERGTFAITGGTSAYTTARGQVTEQQNPPNSPAGTESWLLDIP